MPIPQLDEFRRQFPTACLRTDLLAIHDSHYIVRAQIWVEDALLVSAMAADSVLETAEDRACLRVLHCLNLSASSAKAKPVQLEPESVLPSPAGPAPAPIEINGRSEPQTLGSTPPAAPVKAPLRTLPEEAVSPPLAATGVAEPWADSPTPEIESALFAQPEIPPPLPLNQPALEEPAAEQRIGATSPVDLSDIIAQTDVELRRLGWTVVQGREFLEKTYGKRSRHDLTDQELLEFLLFLETQSSPVGS